MFIHISTDILRKNIYDHFYDKHINHMPECRIHLGIIYLYSNSNKSITYFHWKILALARIWTSDLLFNFKQNHSRITGDNHERPTKINQNESLFKNNPSYAIPCNDIIACFFWLEKKRGVEVSLFAFPFPQIYARFNLSK